jgi:hypothetical protein
MSDAERGPDGRFPKGVSGNPGGRPRRVVELEEAITGAHGAPEVLGVLSKLRELAVAGDVPAAKAYLDRVVGPVRPDPPGVQDDLSQVPTEDLVRRALQNPELRAALAEAMRTERDVGC